MRCRHPRRADGGRELNFRKFGRGQLSRSARLLQQHRPTSDV